MPDVPTTKPSSRVAAFLEKARTEKVRTASRARLIFTVDATGSREKAWDMASKTQAEMFQEAARIGTLDVQLVYFRGIEGFDGECKASRWTNDARELANLMARITCRMGQTQIRRALEHVRKEHQQPPVNAVVYIGDMCEERPQALYDAARELGVPCFMFQEAEDRFAAEIFREIARFTGGAYYSFHPGAADQLRELLQSVGAYAAGGLQALADLRSDFARKLLGQMKKSENRPSTSTLRGGPKMRKDSTLTAADLDNIVTENFAPDIKKLAHEIGTNLYDPEAICSRIAASHGRRELWKVIGLAEIIYGGDEPLWRLIPLSAAIRRKKTTKAEAIARHIAALVKLLENEPDTTIGPALDNLVERINRARLAKLSERAK